MAIDDKFGYARDQLRQAAENSAEHIAWVIARETGRHIGNDTGDVIARRELIYAIEQFLRN